MFEGKILDGWQRYTAAKELAMKVSLTEFTGAMGAAGHFVLAKHARRNVTRAARALAVAQIHACCAASPGAIQAAQGAQLLLAVLRLG
jgi:hypothetical protein